MSISRWMGDAPARCDVMQERIVDEFYDAAVPLLGGTWAIMCAECFRATNASLGIGRGQHYRKNKEGVFECVAGGRGNKEPE